MSENNDRIARIQKIDENIRSYEQEQAKLEERQTQLTGRLAEANEQLEKLGITGRDDVDALENEADEKLVEAEGILDEIESGINNIGEEVNDTEIQ